MANDTINWDDVAVPKSFKLDNHGVYLWDTKKKDFAWISRSMAIIGGETVLETGEETYQLQYLNSMNRTVVQTLPGKMLTGVGFDVLVSIGVDIRPQNKNQILNYLIQQRSLAPIQLTYSTVGWFDNGTNSFGSSELLSLNNKDQGMLKNPSYDLTPQGSRTAWWDMWQRIGSRVELQLALALGLMSSLVKPIGEAYPDIKTLFFSIVGGSSSGKTTMATLALSCAGQPNAGKTGTLALSWSMTVNALTVGLKDNLGIPVLYDELSRFRGGPKSLNDTIYNLAEATEKKRLNRNSTLKATASWSTLLLSTGEFGILDGSSNLVSTNDGLRVRVIEFSGVDWTGSAELSEYIKRTCANNFGWAMPEFVRTLLPIYSQLPKRLKPWIDKAVQYMPKTKYTDRLSVKYAMIGLTLELANKTWGLSIDAEEVLKFAINASKLGWVNDLGTHIFNDLIDYLKVHQRELVLPKHQGSYTNVIGQVDIHDDEMYVDIFELPFKQIVTNELNAQSYKVVIGELRRLNILKSESDRPTLRKTIAGKREKVVSIKIPKEDQKDFAQWNAHDAIATGFSSLSQQPCDDELDRILGNNEGKGA